MTGTTTLQLVPAAGCDCSRCPLWVGNPAAVEPVCSGQNTDCAYCGCARQGDCGECSIRCGSRVDIGAWTEVIGNTFSFDDVDLPGQVLPELASFVPMVDTSNIVELDPGLVWMTYAMGLRRVFSKHSFEVVPSFRECAARETLGLDEQHSTILVGYGEDPLVEAFWARRHEVYPHLAVQQWDLVLAPNFSMYGNQPRTEHLINFRRNLTVAQEMLDLGINAAPNLYWFRAEDLERYAIWLDDVRPAIVAINLQTFRTERDWDNTALPGLHFLSAVLPAETTLVVNGTSRKDRIGILTDLFPRLVLISQNPVQYARHGAVMTVDGRQDVHATVPDAFAANNRFYQNLLETSS